MEIALLAAYGLLLAGAGLRRSARGPEAFFVNSRKAGAFGVGFSIMVSCVGASASIGMIGLAFAVGTPAFWWLGAGAAGLTALALLLAESVRDSGAYTLPHMVERFLGPSVRPLIALVIVTAWSAILAAQFAALSRVLEPLTGLGAPLCLGIGLALVCGHTLGGQSAVMRVDRFQALIILLCLGALLGWLNFRNPAWTSGLRLEAVNADFPLEKLRYFLVIVGANYLVCPMLFGRILSARNGRSARLGALIGAAGIMVCAALIVAVGLACQGLIPADTPQDEVLSAALAGEMPYWLRLAVSFALISAIVSSADSCLVTAATVLSFDLLGRTGSGSGRACVLALGLAGAFISLWGKGILGFLLMAYDIFACGVVMPVFVGLVLRRRLDAAWARASVAVGGALGLASALSGENLFSYAGLGVSLALALGGALRGARAGRGAECA